MSASSSIPASASLPLAVLRLGRDYRVSFLSQAQAEVFGYRAVDLLGKRLSDVVGQEAFEHMRPSLDAAFDGHAAQRQIVLRDHASRERHIQFTLLPDGEEDHDGALVAVIADVTSLMPAPRVDSEFRTLVENSPDIVSRLDRAMRHVYVNAATEQLAGIRAEEWIGKTKAELGLPEVTVRAWDQAIQAAFDTGEVQHFEFELPASAATRYFSGRAIPERGPDGQIGSVIGLAYDVTERTRIQKENDDLLGRERAARIQAETAARARDEFLSVVSHELRAPLNGIQSWAHVLENYIKDITGVPLAQRALQGIKTGVSQQVRLIEDLLDVTRMMSGRLRLVMQPHALLPLLESAVDSVRDLAAAKKVSLHCDYRVTTEQINGDSDRVQQVIWNLLSNAIKFTQSAGNVWISAAQAEGMIAVSVRDDGIGISPDFLPHLFNRFSQEDTSSTRSQSGLGLGLYLVRHLSELHGGRVRVESEGEGRGTTFTVELPLLHRTDKYAAVNALENNVISNLALPSLSGLRILLVDDQAEARESLSILLTAAGANIHAASCGREVTDWLATLAPDAMPDVLICDIAMPEEDGYAVLRKLRHWSPDGQSRPLQRMPALALTAFAEREDRIRALTAGFQMHLTKPVAPEELIVVVNTMAPRNRIPAG
ncbi:hybrid sensor histidine kinase/response regulator [Noviherbaspirillum galbum]|uniref:histidine kinase n=1 Tax=Noviherbaspirillum galbum TaxID=2709383 RepID=A0A6B3SPQ0_9BURK|nr:ATP-binding protein [Noviherbaspirillum galbum]NEX60382.1 PAS domain-containing hybrid sensor histidine kinase/response regulator [Noviherbaspirillum galbum]